MKVCFRIPWHSISLIFCLPLLSLFSFYLWIDLHVSAIPKGAKWPLLALVVESIAGDFVELIGIFSTMEENWRAFGGRRWSE